MTSAAEGRVSRLFTAWNARLPGVGQLSLAAFWLALVTGALLSLDYDHAAAADSLQLLLLTSPAGAFARALHYWSAQLFLVMTALHLVEHLARRSEGRVRLGSWLRLALSPLVVAYLMVSGYVLKGDAEGALARDVMAGLLDRLPLVGAALHSALVGRGDSLQVLYLQHAATASLLTLAFIVEHFRRAWPSLSAWLVTLAACATVAAALPPALHPAADPVVKGPWYMLGLQELLHWLSAPALAWLPVAAGVVLLASLPLLPPPWPGRVKSALSLGLAGYLGLTAIGASFRGEGWRWSAPHWPEGSFADARLFLPDPRMSRAEVPVVLGQREGCLVCHSEVRGLESAHAPQAVGCVSCHGGRPWSGHAGLAHAGMARVPGNLSVARRTCGAAGCHGAIVERVNRSPMANAPGLVGVDRFVFGEVPTPDGGGSLRRLGHSAAASHLSDLCSTCHLGVEKAGPAPIDELSRGGGCTACHLGYHEDRRLHPTLTVKVGDEHCFGCHARSGRISLAYAGWHEPAPSTAALEGASVERRRLADGRLVERRPDDVHHAAGLACVDCHTSRELMGDGGEHAHEEEALEVTCADCHRTGPFASRGWAELDAESQAIVRLRGDGEPSRIRFATAARSGRVLTNLLVGDDGVAFLRGKLDGRRHPLKPPAPACRGMGHDRLSCSACHAGWAPRCLGCHTQLGRDGEWHEAASDFRADPPTLGVRGPERGRVVPFAPGMILTLGTGPVETDRAFLPALARAGRLERLFAPVEPHTTTRAGRSCASCHSNPVALGLGVGGLRLEAGPWPRFVFEPAGEVARDGLPQDAWTGFLVEPRPRASTRSDARPFTAAEQRGILRVGACLECHPPTASGIARVYADFAAALRRRGPRCVVPWTPTGSGR